MRIKRGTVEAEVTKTNEPATETVKTGTKGAGVSKVKGATATQLAPKHVEKTVKAKNKTTAKKTATLKAKNAKAVTVAKTTSPKAKAETIPNFTVENPIGVVKKSGQNMINPREIIVDFNDKSLGRNPRINYGKKGKIDKKGNVKPGEWEVFKDSIRTEGFLQNIKVYKDNDGKFHLRHGFRRMKAMLEILAEGKVDFKLVPVDVVPNNEVEALKDHFRMNNGLPLTDIEQAIGLRNYQKLTGEKMVTKLADDLNIEYVKASNLLKFIEKAHPAIINAVNEKEITFSMAKNVVFNSDTQTEQVKLLKEGREKMKADKEKGVGTGKIRIYHINKVKSAKVSWSEKVFVILKDASTAKELDTDFVNRTLSFLTAVKEGKKEEELETLLAPAQAIAS